MSHRRIFRTLVSAEEALEALRNHYTVAPLGVEDLEIHEAYGRVLAEDVVASIDVPGFDRALMDGYAVRAQDTFGCDEDSPVSLKLVGTVEPGVRPSVEINEQEAAEIATGAAVPRGANAVLMVEYTSEADGFVEAFRPVVPGENVTGAGSDMMTSCVCTG